ncbi:unnamed protein product [[Actinomadura] parvosata subsp. kistnae]|nr:unnamed protein product [Actinomadura parvosata subsp. kistnae]
MPARGPVVGRRCGGRLAAGHPAAGLCDGRPAVLHGIDYRYAPVVTHTPPSPTPCAAGLIAPRHETRSRTACTEP